MTQREYARLVFGTTWTTRLQTTVGLVLYVVLVLITINDPMWGGPWQ